MEQHSPQSDTVRFTHSWASVLFDLMRGLAALIVLCDHWRNLFFVDFPQLTARRSIFAVFYVLSSAGHQAVVVFFLLSGFFIGGAVFRALQHGPLDGRSYLLRRLVRLWVVLVPALLLCLFCDELGLHLGHAPALYSGNVPNHLLSSPIQPSLTPHVFFGNIFFLQTIFTSTFGSDGVLWSLANEFWYYLLFPLAAVALWPRTVPLRRLAAAVGFVLAAWLVHGVILWSFPIWLAGAALYKMPPPRLRASLAAKLRIGATVPYLLLFFALSKLQFIPGLLSDYLLAVATFFYLWLLLSCRTAFPPRARRVHAARELARFSYTLYAVHLPFLVLLASFLLGDVRWYPSSRKILIALCALLASVLYAYALAFLTEFRTDALRERLEHLLGIRPAAPILPSDPARGS